MKIDYTFHSHTYRCGHANGDIGDYVPNAIKHGLRIYGVSDHALLPGDPTNWMRGRYSQLDDYIETFNKVKTKYHNQIRLYLGFECEYGDYYFDYYQSLLKDRGFDYLICGQHNGFRKDGSAYFLEGTEESIYRYKEDIINAIKSGLFLYIAHPDLFFATVKEVTPACVDATKEIIAAAIKYDVPLEVNIHGLLRKKINIEYPAEYFWKETAKTKVKIVVGVDCHDPSEIGDKELTNSISEFVDRCGVILSDIDEIYNNYKKRLEKILNK